MRGADLLSRKGQIVLLREIEVLLGEAISRREIYDAKIDSSFLAKGGEKFDYADIRRSEVSICREGLN